VRDARTYGVAVGTPVPFLPFHCKRMIGELLVDGDEEQIESRRWLWTGSTWDNGIPRRANGRPGGTNLRRLVYERFVGPVRNYAPVNVRCGRDRCLNPAHLVTVRDGSLYEELRALGGLCCCGCGMRTEISKESDASRGRIKGMRVRYVHGHEFRGNRDHVVEVATGFATPCHEHQGLEGSNGYVTGPRGYAHRAVFTDAGVTIGAAWRVHHRCHNRRCCNPSHLALVPRAQNEGLGTGSPTDRAVEEIRNRYASRSIRGDIRPYAVCDLGHSTPCWVWLRQRSWNGYPVRSYTSVERRRPRAQRPEQYAHRYLWAQRYGPIPTGLQLDHMCNVKACVNPDHLELATAAENHARRLQRLIARERREWGDEGTARL
jgi:hypothetical protein